MPDIVRATEGEGNALQAVGPQVRLRNEAHAGPASRPY